MMSASASSCHSLARSAKEIAPGVLTTRWINSKSRVPGSGLGLVVASACVRRAACLCHNLSVLVHAIHELGIEPSFWSRMEAA